MLRITVEFDPGGMGNRCKPVADLEITRRVTGGGKIYDYKMTELAASFKESAFNCSGNVCHDRSVSFWFFVAKIAADAASQYGIDLSPSL